MVAGRRRSGKGRRGRRGKNGKKKRRRRKEEGGGGEVLDVFEATRRLPRGAVEKRSGSVKK